MRRNMTYAEWQREQAALEKAPASGGVRALISPGFGSMGYQQPGNIPGGNVGLPTPIGHSQYNDDRTSQPPPYIEDVDMSSNWWSPMQPVWPYGPPGISRPREWDYPVGYNLNYIQPRIDLMAMLRGMRSSWGVLATIIETRKDQLLRIPWTIQDKKKPGKVSAGVEEMRKFFKRPDGILSYSQWSRKLLDDLLVLDAPSIYFTRDRRGRPLSAEVMNGATIFPLIDDAGRRPSSTIELSEDGLTYLKRQPAFQQIIKGMPLVDLDESELMYVPMRPLPDFPIFGYPPTQQIFIEASEAVRKTFYQLNFWAEGTIPDLIVTVPDAWTPRHIAMFQAHFDALLSGNLNLKSKVRFLPGGMKPFDVKNSSGESLWSQRDETLIRLACYSYSVSPTPFVKQTNRSVAQNAQQTAEEEGLFPLMSYWADDIINVIIQEKFGYEDIEFIFLPRPEPDQEKAAKIHDTKIKNGELSINEARDEDGLEPIPGGEVHLIHVGNAIVPLQDAAAGKAMPVQGGTGTSDSPGGGGAKATPKTPAKPVQGQPQRGANVPATRAAVNKFLNALAKATPAQLHDAAAQAKGHLDAFSAPQLAAGNYPKGHIWFQGLNISIENGKGSTKRGKKTPQGTEWAVTMPAHYGYIRGTIGADDDQIDVYLGKRPESRTVWVIDQNKVSKKGKVKGFDEHKVGLGYTKLRKFLKDYLKSHPDGRPERVETITELSMKEFKNWLASGNTRAPLADQAGKTVLTRDDLTKLDTISTSTNLASYSQGAPTVKPKKKKKPSLGARWLQLTASASQN